MPGGHRIIRVLVRNFSAVTGTWNIWGSWSACTKTCGSGIRMRSRTCSNAHQCDTGAPTEEQACNQQTCSGKRNERENCLPKMIVDLVPQYLTVPHLSKSQTEPQVGTPDWFMLSSMLNFLCH